MWVLRFRSIAIVVVVGRRRCAAGGTRRQHVTLSIHGPSTLEELPVRGAGGQVEGSGINEYLAFVDLGEEEGIFGKANVVADDCIV